MNTLAMVSIHEALDKMPTWGWIALAIICVLAVFRHLGTKADRRQSQDFAERMKSDIETLARPYFNGGEEALSLAVERILRQSEPVDMGPSIHAITAEIAEKDKDDVEVVMALEVSEKDGRRIRKTATRTYGREYLPTDISANLIRFGGKDNRTLYPFKAQTQA